MRVHDPALYIEQMILATRNAMTFVEGLSEDMRDRIAHGYETLNFPIIWQTVRDDLPSLLQVLEPILAELDGAGSPGRL